MADRDERLLRRFSRRDFEPRLFQLPDQELADVFVSIHYQNFHMSFHMSFHCLSSKFPKTAEISIKDCGNIARSELKWQGPCQSWIAAGKKSNAPTIRDYRQPSTFEPFFFFTGEVSGCFTTCKGPSIEFFRNANVSPAAINSGMLPWGMLVRKMSRKQTGLLEAAPLGRRIRAGHSTRGYGLTPLAKRWKGFGDLK